MEKKEIKDQPPILIAETEESDEQRALDQAKLDEQRESTSSLPQQQPPIPTDSVSREKSKPSSRKSNRSSSPQLQDHVQKKSKLSTDDLDTDTDISPSNIRLERLKQALDRFLDLIEYKANCANISKSLPRMNKQVVDSIRQQFIQQLKEAIKEENEKLIQENGLDVKLAELHSLAQEADERYQQGLRPGSDQLKDVWRTDLDIETAISARAIPEQEARVSALKQEWEEIQSQNAQIHSELKLIQGQVLTKRTEAKQALDALDSAVKGLEASPEMQKKLRQTMDELLSDLGARV